MMDMTRNTNKYDLNAREMARASEMFASLSFDSHELDAFLFGFAAALGRLKDPEEPKNWLDEEGADDGMAPVTGAGNEVGGTVNAVFPAPAMDFARSNALQHALQLGGHNGVVGLLKAADKIRDYITGQANPLADEVNRLEQSAQETRERAAELRAVNKGRRQKTIAVLAPFVLEARKANSRPIPPDGTHVAIDLKHCEAADELCKILTAVDTGFQSE